VSRDASLHHRIKRIIRGSGIIDGAKSFLLQSLVSLFNRFERGFPWHSALQSHERIQSSRLSVFCVVLLAFLAVPLQHLLRVVNQAVCLSNTFTKELLAGLDFACLLLTAFSAFLLARHRHLERSLPQTFPKQLLLMSAMGGKRTFELHPTLALKFNLGCGWRST
jgi:hypothetical protein